MGEVIALDEKRRRLRARRAFHLWEKRFGRLFDENTSVHDLPDEVLAVLVQPGDVCTRLVQSLVVKVMTGEDAADLEGLSPPQKIRAIDLTLLMVDQIRFECMRRLGWVEPDPRTQWPIVDLLIRYVDGDAPGTQQTPGLLPSHPLYAQYEKAFAGDQAAFVRKLIPRAIEEFMNRRKS
ncbi:MAG: hypothetical protein WHS86_10655 [Desulfosoma sp.]